MKKIHSEVQHQNQYKTYLKEFRGGVKYKRFCITGLSKELQAPFSHTLVDKVCMTTRSANSEYLKCFPGELCIRVIPGLKISDDHTLIRNTPITAHYVSCLLLCKGLNTSTYCCIESHRGEAFWNTLCSSPLLKCAGDSKRHWKRGLPKPPEAKLGTNAQQRTAASALDPAGLSRKGISQSL